MDNKPKVKIYETYITPFEYEQWRLKLARNEPLQSEIAALLIGRAEPVYEEGTTK
jgi:hypothetical protein